jgi:hypothetical protein
MKNLSSINEEVNHKVTDWTDAKVKKTYKKVIKGGDATDVKKMKTALNSHFAKAGDKELKEYFGFVPGANKKKGGDKKKKGGKPAFLKESRLPMFESYGFSVE